MKTNKAHAGGNQESGGITARPGVLRLAPPLPPPPHSSKSLHVRPRERNEGTSTRKASQRSVSAQAELAHDARNLLSAVNLYCELLRSPGVLAPQFRHYAEDLLRVGEAGARLIADLAGPGAGCGTWSPRRRSFSGIQDLGTEVKALEGTLRAVTGTGVRLEVECAPCAGELALSGEDLLRILFNLVANAVEAFHIQGENAGRRGTRSLRITAQQGHGGSFFHDSSALPATVMLSVRDNGPGIPPSDLPHIFETGFSSRERWEGPTGGNPEDERDTPRGLGLSIVRRLVEDAGGTVRAVSSRGLGTRFDVVLPVIAPGGETSGLRLVAGEMTEEFSPIEK